MKRLPKSVLTNPRDKLKFLYHIWRHDWPRFAREALGVKLDAAQEEILATLERKPRVVVKSGHARGKDFLAAVASLCFLYLVRPSKVISTAPTGRQVFNIMLSEAKTIWQSARLPLGGRFISTGIRFDNAPDRFMLGFKAGDTEPEAWTGFHSPNIMVVATEASGIEQATFDALEGLLTGNSRLLLVLNPNRVGGEAYKAFQSPLYQKFTLSCLDAPNVVARKTLIPGQVDWDWINALIQKPGWVTQIPQDAADATEGDFEWSGQWYRPSDLFRVKVLGLWPRESEDQLIPLSWVEAANERWREQSRPEKPLRLGSDIAGMGSDMTVFAYRYGDYVERFQALAKSDHMASAGHIMAALGTRHDSWAFVDTIGEGAGVYSRLIEQGANAVSVKFSESADGLNDLTDEREFQNMRAYCWWAIRDALDPKLSGHLALPPIDELTQDLTAVHWKLNSQGRILLEDKDDIKAYLGRSPDYGDALANTYYPHGAKAAALTGLDVYPG